MQSSFHEYYRQRFLAGRLPGFILSISLNQKLPAEALAGSILRTGEQFPELFQHLVNEEITQIRRKVHLNEVIVSDPPLDHSGEFDWNRIFENINIPLEGVNWRVLVSENRLGLFLNHVLYDGTSSRHLAEKIIQNANNGCTSDDLWIYQGSDSESHSNHFYDQLPSSWLEWLIRKSLPLYLKWISPLLRKRGAPYTLLRHDIRPQESSGDTSCDRIIWNIPAAALCAVLTRCRDERISLTSFLVAKILDRLAQLPPPNRSGNRVIVSVPVNTRPYIASALKISREDLALGLFVCAGPVCFDLGDHSSFHHACQKVQRGITAVKGNQADRINEIRALSELDVGSYVKAQLVNPEPAGTFELSNIGRIDVLTGSKSKYHLLNALFVQPRLTSAYFSVSVVSTYSGGATAVIAYPPDLRESLEGAFASLSSEF